MSDSSLWGVGAPLDPEVEALERTLRPLAFQLQPLDLDRPEPAGAARWIPSDTRAGWWMAVAAAAVLASASAVWLARRPAIVPGWDVQALAGEPRVGGRPAAATARWAVGEELLTDARSRARASFPHGHVELGPGSRARLLRASENEQRLRLDQGLVRAQVLAPPRLFLVETASALAVDLGCAYELRVDEAGAGVLDVTEGQVALEARPWEAIVPAGASCRLRPGRGPGTPYFRDASEEMRTALARFDDGAGASDLEAVLSSARPRDAITLWHLLSRTDGPAREHVYDRLAALAPPMGLAREALLRLDPQALTAWRTQFGHGPFLKKKKAFNPGGVR
jgi:hypothetical protein